MRQEHLVRALVFLVDRHVQEQGDHGSPRLLPVQEPLEVLFGDHVGALPVDGSVVMPSGDGETGEVKKRVLRVSSHDRVNGVFNFDNPTVTWFVICRLPSPVAISRSTGSSYPENTTIRTNLMNLLLGQAVEEVLVHGDLDGE